MRTLALALVTGCAVHAPALPAQHPASPTAAVGQLAPAPPALRPGVVDYKDVPALRQGEPTEGHHHHGH